MSSAVRVYMLGKFTIAGSAGQVDDSQNRSKKVWALLACLICSHGRVMSQGELVDLLWGEDKDRANPVNALKTTLHRARTMLAEILPEGEGTKLIVSKNGGYVWNDQIPLWLDVEEFERLCRTPAKEAEDGGLTRCRQALELYRGEFLNRLTSENWVIPRAAYYHNLYVQTVGRVLEQMETHGLWEEAEGLCRAALKQEPYREDFYQHLMRNLIALGRQKQAVSVYEEMSQLLRTNFGVIPDQESRRLYREALRTTNRRTVPMDVIREQLREQVEVRGAMLCDYDFFKTIYQAEARMVARSGNAVHIVLFSLTDGRGKEVSQRSMDLAMDNFQDVVRMGLRQGDVIARCSPSQFVVMLPQANYENSVMVSQRLLKAFNRQYPHTPVVVEFGVYPLEPVENIPAASEIK